MRRNKILVCAISFFIMAIPLSSFCRGPLTFEERVKAQEAIERVFYSHRIWPKENPQPKPAFEKMVTRATIEAKVTECLKTSAALEKFWYRPITGEQLQAEMDRMAKGTKDPAVLNELFEVLNNDPYLIAECLAHPVLADRLVRNWYANDERFHKETREKAEEAMKHLTPENFCNYPEGQYNKIRYYLDLDGNIDDYESPESDEKGIPLDQQNFSEIKGNIPEEGALSEISEEKESFFVSHTIVKNESEMEIEYLSFSKISLGEWFLNQGVSPEIPSTDYGAVILAIPPVTASACTEGWWDNGILDGSPEPASQQTVIWTGTEMFVWGGYNGSWYLSWGGRYNPATDTWVPTSIGANCPSARAYHTAIWTGSEMIIWGGGFSDDHLNTGARYNPETDSWLATSTGTNCPQGRREHTAVWTGTKMIIWGGIGADPTKTGGIYDPSTDSWTATSTEEYCPSSRYNHTAVWTGSKMIVWGGSSDIKPRKLVESMILNPTVGQRHR